MLPRSSIEESNAEEAFLRSFIFRNGTITKLCISTCAAFNLRPIMIGAIWRKATSIHILFLSSVSKWSLVLSSFDGR